MRISLFQSLKYRKINILVFSPASCHIEKDAEILIDGKLTFNLRSNPKIKNRTCGYLIIGKKAKLQLNGYFDVLSGCTIGISDGAVLSMRSGYMNYGAKIYCFNKISMGNDVRISEGVTIRDSDNHTILDGRHQKSSPISIGDHVWIGLNSTILKGVTIGDGAIIAAGAVVVHDVPPKSIVAGIPARVIRENVEWE